MDLQSYLTSKFRSWKPSPPEVVSRSKSSVTLSWEQQQFRFLQGDLIYRLEKKEKIPPWVVTYSGSETTRLIDYLPPCSPHRFRLRVILKASAVPSLVENALKYYGDEISIYKDFDDVIPIQKSEQDESNIKTIDDSFEDITSVDGTRNEELPKNIESVIKDAGDESVNVTDAEQVQISEVELIDNGTDVDELASGDTAQNIEFIKTDLDVINKVNVNVNENMEFKNAEISEVNESDSKIDVDNKVEDESVDEKSEIDITVTQDESINNRRSKRNVKGWLESLYSEELWTSTESDGTSAVCFCMAVRGGYLKQVQVMLDEKPDLIGMINITNGFTPLATAVRKGDINTVRFLLSAGACAEQPSGAGQTALHMATLAAQTAIADLLIEKGALIETRDVNGLRAEHYAADSGCIEMVRLIRQRGGDFTAKDYNKWTPLFRAVCQGASTELIEELVSCSELDVHDAAGLHLSAAARLLKDPQGRSRDAVLRLVDAHFPREHARANFTRLSNKIYRVHALFKML